MNPQKFNETQPQEAHIKIYPKARPKQNSDELLKLRNK